jgi:hypothetical protein
VVCLRQQALYYVCLLGLIYIAIHDGLAPKQSKDATNDQKWAIGDVIAHRADACRHEQKADQASRKDRDHYRKHYVGEPGDQTDKRCQLDVTSAHAAGVKQSDQVKGAKANQTAD